MIIGKPTLAITGGWFLLMMSVGPNPAQLTISASAGRGVVENGSGAVIAVVIPEPVRRTRTSTSPAVSSKVIESDIGLPNSDPRLASTNAVPTFGCPANGTSVVGVKIRTWAVWAGSAGG